MAVNVTAEHAANGLGNYTTSGDAYDAYETMAYAQRCVCKSAERRIGAAPLVSGLVSRWATVRPLGQDLADWSETAAPAMRAAQ